MDKKIQIVKMNDLPFAMVDGYHRMITFETKEIRDFFEHKWLALKLVPNDTPIYLPDAFHFEIMNIGDPERAPVAKMCYKIYNCLVLNDEVGRNWATYMEMGIKTIETRFKTFKYRGDLIICCGNKSQTRNKGLVVCIVDLYDALPMKVEHEEMACIEAVPGRIAHLTRNLRHFSRKFEFTKRYVSGSYQSIFQITLPGDVTIG